MRIQIQPVQHWDPNKGLVTLTHANVEMGQPRLGDSAVPGNIELGYVEVPPVDAGVAKIERFFPVVNGRRTLNPEQFAGWKPADALYFAQCIVKNAGLTPADATAPAAA